MGNLVAGLVFQPPPLTYSSHQENLLWLRTASGKLVAGRYFPHEGAQLTVLHSHGNAEDIGMIWPWIQHFGQQLQVNVMTYDYEGYGLSSAGQPNEQACYEDIDAAYAHLNSTLNIPASNIILFGRSLGSGPSCYLAHRLSKAGVDLGGVMLQSPLLSVYRVLLDVRFSFYGDQFPNIDYMESINCPVLVIHGILDEIVPFWNGETLFLAIPEEWRAKPLWVQGAGHNDIENKLLGRPPRNEYFMALRDFVAEWVTSRIGS
jgi:fermentation-respiration switch protein FrsA (DUF1100 family)